MKGILYVIDKLGETLALTEQALEVAQRQIADLEAQIQQADTPAEKPKA